MMLIHPWINVEMPARFQLNDCGFNHILTNQTKITQMAPEITQCSH